MAAGATVGIVGVLNGADLGLVTIAPFYLAFSIGFLGVPTYVIVTGIASVFRWAFGKHVS